MDALAGYLSSQINYYSSAMEGENAVEEKKVVDVEAKVVEKPDTQQQLVDEAEAKEQEAKDEEAQDSWLTGANAWGTSWIQTAKEKTLSTLESMKKDLNEFSDTVQKEATVLASATANSVKQQVQLIEQFVKTPDGEDGEEKQGEEEAQKEADPSSSSSSTAGFFGTKWVKSIVETVQKLGVEDTTKEEEKYTEEIRVGMPRKTALDQLQLQQIQNDERTFLHAPALNIELYREWLEEFKIAEYNGEINMLLGYNPKLREIYSKLVPSKVDNHTFWNRYFFKVHILELDKAVMEKEKKESPESNSNVEKDETWSMCSSANNDIQDLEAEELEEEAVFDQTLQPQEEGEASQLDRQETLTPQLQDDDWEKCENK